MKMNVTVAVTFTPEQLARYKKAFEANFGDNLKTKKDVQDQLAQEAQEGIYMHLEVMGIEPQGII